MLSRMFVEFEIKEAMWECESLKCSRLDDINFKFIIKFWHLMKDDVRRFIDDFHQNGSLLRGCNAFFVTFIPKVEDPQNF